MTNTASVSDLAEIAAGFAARDAAAPDVYPAENIADIKRSGVLIAPFPEHLGGAGASLLDAVRMTETVAKQSPSTALMLSMPLGLASVYGAPLEAIPEQHRGLWNEQSEAIAAEYRAGKWYAACNSEKGAGGSLAATKTTARLVGGTWRVSGDKILATTGKYADYFFSSAKVTQDDLPGGGVVEMFYVKTDAPGVAIAADWDGFGMRSTESQSVRYDDAPADGMLGYPDFLEHAAPSTAWYCLFAAVPLGCAASILAQVANPVPQSPALRLRLADAQMRLEALTAYLHETAVLRGETLEPRSLSMRVIRAKTYVTQESTKLCAELFALSGGRNYSRTSPVARALADSFAGTALRPPLALALDMLVENFAI
ncbi:MAG: acyl-CoA dehydrogenase family protein [Dehalococcoidia bacterium]